MLIRNNHKLIQTVAISLFHGGICETCKHEVKEYMCVKEEYDLNSIKFSYILKEQNIKDNYKYCYIVKFTIFPFKSPTILRVNRPLHMEQANKERRNLNDNKMNKGYFTRVRKSTYS